MIRVVVKRENYINIQGWMVTELALKGNSLLIYAIIYGFSQEEGQWFRGSLQYLADWTNSSKYGVSKSLKVLVEAGLLEKEDSIINGVKFCSYRATKLDGDMQQSCSGQPTKLDEGMQQSCTNNLLDNAKDNLANKKKVPGKPAARSGFIKPTLEQIKAYCLERKNNVDAQRFLDYYESNGWKVGRNPMRDWKATVRTWERNNFASKSEKPAASTDYGSPEDFYR